jgi:hypothetical protein
VGTGVVETKGTEVTAVQSWYCREFWDDGCTYCGTGEGSCESVCEWDGGCYYCFCTGRASTIIREWKQNISYPVRRFRGGISSVSTRLSIFVRNTYTKSTVCSTAGSRHSTISKSTFLSFITTTLDTPTTKSTSSQHFLTTKHNVRNRSKVGQNTESQRQRKNPQDR